MITDLVSPVSIFVTVTTTPGSTPPDSSVTVPSMMPLIACPWAAAIEARERTSRTAATPRNMGKPSRLVQMMSIACVYRRARPSGRADVPGDVSRGFVCRLREAGFPRSTPQARGVAGDQIQIAPERTDLVRRNPVGQHAQTLAVHVLALVRLTRIRVARASWPRSNPDGKRRPSSIQFINRMLSTSELMANSPIIDAMPSISGFSWL